MSPELLPGAGKPTSEETEIRVLLARFETKLDLVIGQHDARLSDHETRIRVVERRKVVTPTGLLSAAVGVVTVLGGFVLFIDRLTSGVS